MLRFSRGGVLALLLAMAAGVQAAPQSPADDKKAPDTKAAPAAEDAPAKEAAPPPADPNVVALIGDRPVTRDEVERELAPIQAQGAIPDKMLPLWQAKALDMVIERRIVLDLLERSEQTVKPAEIDAAVGQLKQKLGEQKLTWEQFLAKQKTTDEAMREQIRWQMSWNRYAARELTDEVLDDLFKSQQAEYDGRKIRVSHILLRPAGPGGEAEIKRLVQQAAEIRARIEKQELTFAEAAKQYSDGPSRSAGGDLGSIARHGEMVEPFAKAAFALGKGEISPPVVTPFGIHLIQCTEVDAGSKTAADNRDDLRKAAALLLFQRIAAQERRTADVTFTGNWPYFDGVTRQLVVPK
ncbi:MAG: peptidylprolyl isomerase [Pirellulales bacterium]